MPHEGLQGSWEKIGADLFEFESTNYLLIADYYSWFPIIRRIKSTMTSAITDVMKQVFTVYGIPKTMISDRGSVFIKGFQIIDLQMLL